MAAAVKTWDEWMNIFAIILFQRALYVEDRLDYVLKQNMQGRERERKKANSYIPCQLPWDLQGFMEAYALASPLMAGLAT